MKREKGIALKKLNESDLVFINKPLNEKEEREFSKFLKARKTKTLVVKKTRIMGRKKTAA